MTDYVPRLNENTLPPELMDGSRPAAPPDEVEIVPARVIRAPERPAAVEEAPEGPLEAEKAPEGTQEAQEAAGGTSMFYRQENGEHLIYVDGPSLEAVTSYEVKMAAYEMRTRLGLADAGIGLKHHAHIIQPGEEPETAIRGPEGLTARLVYKLSGMPHGAAGTPVLGRS